MLFSAEAGVLTSAGDSSDELELLEHAARPPTEIAASAAMAIVDFMVSSPCTSAAPSR
jgi:hypothetical protein